MSKPRIYAALLLILGIAALLNVFTGRSEERPDDEMAFIKEVDRWRVQFDSAANPIKESTMRTERAAALGLLLGNTRAVGPWIGRIMSIGDKNGRASIDIRITEAIHIVTIYDTEIIRNTAIYSALADIREGSVVRFSAVLLRDTTGGPRELSTSEAISMRMPRFAAGFTNIAPHYVRGDNQTAVTARSVEPVSSMEYQAPTGQAPPIAPIEMRNGCRNAIQAKMDNWDISFQHADLEEPQTTMKITVWSSWFKSPRNGDIVHFVCIHDATDDTFRVRLTRREEMP